MECICHFGFCCLHESRFLRHSPDVGAFAFVMIAVVAAAVGYYVLDNHEAH
jgi:hypothetical protein